MLIIEDSDIAIFNLNSSINLSASKSCFLYNSKIWFVFKFLLYFLLNLFDKAKPEIKLSISDSRRLVESKFSFFAAK